MALAAALLLPFLNTPFTIDDPIYLREAQHLLSDPLRPQAFNMVWSTDLNLRASQILPGGIAFPYLLLPTVVAGSSEWVGHLTELICLLGAVFATGLMAMRLGLTHAQTRAATLLVASCPAVLGMAGTVMPDIPALLFAILGMERIAAWREQGRWPEAIAVTFWLTLAALTRTHTLLLLIPAAIHLSGASFKRFAPLAMVPIAALAVMAITADPESRGDNILIAMLHSSGGWRLPLHNGLAFLSHWLLVIPLTIPWLVLRFRRLRIVILIGMMIAALLALRIGWVAFPAIASLIVLLDILIDALRRRDRLQLALWSWLLIAMPIVLYIHLPSRYLLPSLPAAAILIARILPESSRRLIPATALLGATLGILILIGIRDLAETQRRAVTEIVQPHIQMGHHVWLAGHWGFQWYGELAGAHPATLQPPFPAPGDIVVVSPIDLPRFYQEWKSRTVLEKIPYTGNGIGRVMDSGAGIGFFSSAFGYLPWAPGAGTAARIEVWRIE